MLAVFFYENGLPVEEIELWYNNCMKKIYYLIGLIILAGGAWYFGSPLLLNKEVNEELPEVIPAKPQNLTTQEKQQILALFEDRIVKGEIEVSMLPTEEELDTMSDAEFFGIEQLLMEMSKKDPDVVMKEVMPINTDNNGFPVQLEAYPKELSKGSFKGVDSFHKGEGIATILDLDGTNRVLRLENFSVTNGPDLRVYLSSHPNPSKSSEVTGGASIELAKLKGNKGNQNYEVPDNVNIDDFSSVVIYCKPFRVIFATAALN